MALNSYRRAFQALSPELQSQRAAAWAHFEATGLPSRKLEEWHYTDLSALNEAEFVPAAASASYSAPAAVPGADTVQFDNGRRVQAAPAQSLPRVFDDAVTALNAALATDGLDWTVAAGETAPPLHLLMSYTGGTASGMSHLRHQIRIGRGAQASLLMQTLGDDAEALATVVTEIEVEAGGRLDIVRLQNAGGAATELARTDIRLARDASLHYVGLDVGGALTRHDLNVQLAEAGASVELHGVFAPGGGTHADTHTRIIHAAPHCTSREVFRGLVMDRARAVFNGKIVVKPGAQKTDSEQSIASLLLSEKAQVNAKPELEIFADDVKCAHGATCGRLDEMAVYYLRSRGLDLTTARNLLLFTFASEVLHRISWAAAREAAEALLRTRLPNAPELEALP